MLKLATCPEFADESSVFFPQLRCLWSLEGAGTTQRDALELLLPPSKRDSSGARCCHHVGPQRPKFFSPIASSSFRSCHGHSRRLRVIAVIRAGITTLKLEDTVFPKKELVAVKSNCVTGTIGRALRAWRASLLCGVHWNRHIA